MTTLIEEMAKNICLSLGFNPMERVEAGDTMLWKWECYQPAAQAALTALQESGYVVVPAKANRDLFDAWSEAAWPDGEVIYADEFVGPEAQFDAAYTAMLSALPDTGGE